jgi:hypothetical protein
MKWRYAAEFRAGQPADDLDGGASDPKLAGKENRLLLWIAFHRTYGRSIYRNHAVES